MYSVSLICGATELQMSRCDYLAVRDPHLQFITIQQIHRPIRHQNSRLGGFYYRVGSTGHDFDVIIQCSLAEVITVILQMRLYALYYRSKRLLVFMVTLSVAEVGIVLWILISNNLFVDGVSLVFIESSTVSGSDLCHRFN